MKIENIVCSGSFNQELDLTSLSRDVHIEYKLNKYPGAYIKYNGHSITIYHTGKYIMPGMRSFDDVRQTFVLGQVQGRYKRRAKVFPLHRDAGKQRLLSGLLCKGY